MSDPKTIFEEGAGEVEPMFVGNAEGLGMSSEEVANVERNLVVPSSTFVMDTIPPTDHSNTVAGNIASINSVITPDVPFQQHHLDAVSGISEVGEDVLIADTLTKFDAYYRDVVKEMLVDAVNTLPPEEAVATGSDAATMLGITGEQLSELDAIEQAQILALGGQDNQEAAERMYYQRTLQSITENTSIWEDVVNFGGMFIPDWSLDTSRITGGSVLDAADDLKQMIFNFQSLPLEQRMRVWPQLVDDVMEASDENEAKAVAELMMFISPTREADIDLMATLEKIDIATIAAPILGGIAKSIKGYRTVSNITKSGDLRKAAELNAAALSDRSGTVSRAVGTEQDVAAMNTSPFQFSDEGIAEATDGLAGETAKTIETMHRRRRAVQEELAPILDKRNYLFEESLTPAERAVVQERGIESMDGVRDAYYESFGYYPERATIVNRTDEGFTVELDLAGTSQTKTVQYKKNDVGDFDSIEASESSNFWSPSVWMDKIQTDSVEVATRIGFQQSKLLGDLTRAAKVATKGLSSKQRTRVDDVLLAGDEFNKGAGRNFSIADLKAGIHTQGGLVRMADNEVASYYAQRDIYNALHFMKENQVFRSLEFKGFKEVKINDVDSIVLPLGRNNLPESIVAKDPDFLVYNARGPFKDGNGGITSARDLDLDELYGNGFQIVKFQKTEKFGDELIEYGVVQNTQISDLRRVGLLNKRSGYVPKAAREGFYFVKQIGDTMVSGKAVRGGEVRTLRMFDNKKDAGIYAEEQAAKDGSKRFEVLHDRQMSTAEFEEEMINEAGGLFTSSRATHDITFGLKGDKPARISAAEAMERNLMHISNNIPMNEFRLGVQQRWLNSARGHLVKEGDFHSPIKDEVGSAAEIGLRKSREWIQDQLRIPTESERRWSSFARATAEWIEGTPTLVQKALPRKTILEAARVDPFGNIRGYTFHALLGWFNPAQLWVQAQGASIALAMDPVGWAPTTQRYMAFRAAWFGRGNETLLKNVSKAAGMKQDELRDIVKEIDRSGIMDSVRTTADYAAAEKGFGINRGAVKRVADGGLVFFREGEMFTRGYSYLSARRAFVKANPGVKIGNDEIKAIVQDSLRRMMNLNRANRAQWQKGAVSVPLQFKQVFAKFAENMLGKTGKWTPDERFRVMIGQAALYGAAGIPLGDTLATYVADTMGKGPGELSDEQVAIIEDGMWGYLSEVAFDEQFELGTRGSLVDGFNGMVNSILIEDAPLEVYETAFGPFFTLPNRMSSALKTLAPMILQPHKIEWTATEATIAASSVASIMSSWNNAHKAWVWSQTGEVRDNKGRKLFDVDPNKDLALILGKAFGFTPARISDFYETKGFNLNYKKMMQEKASAVNKVALEYYTSKLTEKDLRNLQLKQKFLLIGANAEQVTIIKKLAAKQLSNDKDIENENLRKAIKIYLESGDPRPGTGLLGGSDITFNPQLNKETE